MEKLDPRNRFICSRDTLDAMSQADQSLITVLKTWRELRGDSKIPPTRASLVPEEHLRGVLGFAHIIDCSDEDPLNYQFRLFSSNVKLFGGDFTKRTVAQLPDHAWSKQVAHDYRQVTATGCPTFHKVTARINWSTAKYTRLILPLTNQKREIAQLLVCLNPRPLPELGELPL